MARYGGATTRRHAVMECSALRAARARSSAPLRVARVIFRRVRVGTRAVREAGGGLNAFYGAVHAMLRYR